VEIQSTASSPTEWDAYVSRHPHGSAYHLSAAVSIGNETFGLRTTYCVAREPGGQLIGVLPVVEQSSVLFGRFHVSLPFFTYGGILADDADVAGALARHAMDLARARRAGHLELRHTTSLSGLNLPQRTDKVSMVLPLPSSEAALSKQLGAKLRSQIRRAERDAPEIAWGGVELIHDFYGVFAQTMHELGTPVYPLRFFEVTCRALSGLIKVLIIRVRGQVQAAAILVSHGSRIEVPWAAATPSAKRAAINMRMYWEMLRESVRLEAQAFDFGRSTQDSGTYRFKAQWGAQPVQLHWHYWLPRGASIPKLNHSNPKYALAASVWRRMPLWCANILGPHIVRNLP
jgi:serine/alanine adding enzyme